MVLKRGSADSTLDDKGRVNIPVRFREHFQGELVITRGMEKCAMIMKPAVWERFEQAESISEALNEEEWEAFKNKHLNEARDVEIDKAGRIAIPPKILKYANLSKTCTVIRDEDRLFIWDTDDYEAYLAETNPVAKTAMNKLGSQGIFRVKQDGK